MSSSPPCRHFLRGACRYGDACKFAHAARDADAARAPRSRSRKTRRKDSRQKVKRFREWLAREFADALDGGVVLDVAGGKGVLAFDLMNSTNAAEVWVIDPRAMRLGRLRRRFALGFHLRERERDAATIRVREPKHLRVYWSREVYAREDAAWEARVRASNVAARASRWCVSGLVADDRRDARYEDAGATVRVVDGAVDIAPSTDRRSDEDDADDDAGDAGDDENVSNSEKDGRDESESENANAPAADEEETRVGSYVAGDSFGELALLYSCPRAATVRATEECALWQLERRVYVNVKRSYQGACVAAAESVSRRFLFVLPCPSRLTSTLPTTSVRQSDCSAASARSWSRASSSRRSGRRTRPRSRTRCGR
jgi:hypothetical protein